jgi:hypothetical protein
MSHVFTPKKLSQADKVAKDHDTRASSSTRTSSASPTATTTRVRGSIYADNSCSAASATTS